MSERFKISYRDYEEKDFNILSMNMENVDETRSLLAKANEAIPYNRDERELLEEYKETLKNLIDNQTKFNEIKKLIAKMSPAKDATDASMVLNLIRSAQSIAVRINHIKQDIGVFNMTDDIRKILNQKKIVEKNNVPINTHKKANKYSMKEKFSETFGVVGVIAYFVIRLIISVLPFVMIGGNFFLTLLLISINTFVPFASAIFWIWGLVCAIKGVQDVWAIIYYIVFAVVWIPFYVSTIASFFKRD